MTRVTSLYQIPATTGSRSSRFVKCSRLPLFGDISLCIIGMSTVGEFGLQTDRPIELNVAAGRELHKGLRQLGGRERQIQRSGRSRRQQQRGHCRLRPGEPSHSSILRRRFSLRSAFERPALYSANLSFLSIAPQSAIIVNFEGMRRTEAFCNPILPQSWETRPVPYLPSKLNSKIRRPCLCRRAGGRGGAAAAATLTTTAAPRRAVEAATAAAGRQPQA